MKTPKAKQLKSPLAGLNGQLMVTAAHRYCLGRQSYIVSSCIEWLREWWPSFTPNTKNVILRDTIESLQDGTAGADMDIRGWTQFADWAFDQLSGADKKWVVSAVAHRHKPWPLTDPLVIEADGSFQRFTKEESLRMLAATGMYTEDGKLKPEFGGEVSPKAPDYARLG